MRGLWWLAGSTALLAEHVDESAVAIRWIADPAQPEREPHPHRYPAAGTANPVARLFRITLDGDRTEIDWDHEAYPYLATVQPDDDGGAVISVLSRDQRRQLILDLSADGDVRTAGERTCAPWITMQAGVPCRGAGRRSCSRSSRTPTTTASSSWPTASRSPPPTSTSPGSSTRRADRILVTAQPGPMDQGVYAVEAGVVTSLTPADGVHSAVAGAGGIVIASTDPAVLGTRYEARLPGGTAEIAVPGGDSRWSSRSSPSCGSPTASSPAPSCGPPGTSPAHAGCPSSWRPTAVRTTPASCTPQARSPPTSGWPTRASPSSSSTAPARPAADRPSSSR